MRRFSEYANVASRTIPCLFSRHPQPHIYMCIYIYIILPYGGFQKNRATPINHRIGIVLTIQLFFPSLDFFGGFPPLKVSENALPQGNLRPMKYISFFFFKSSGKPLPNSAKTSGVSFLATAAVAWRGGDVNPGLCVFFLKPLCCLIFGESVSLCAQMTSLSGQERIFNKLNHGLLDLGVDVILKETNVMFL